MHLRAALVAWSVALSMTAACTNHPSLPREIGAYRVTFVGNPDLGSAEKPIPFSTTAQTDFVVDIQALTYVDKAWVVDTSYSGIALISVQPTGSLDGDPQVVELKAGVAQGVKVRLHMARGPVRLVVTDPGLVLDPTATEIPCDLQNPKDKDKDGFAGYGDDRGCFATNDNSEAGGTASTGTSPTITFANPRLSDLETPGPKTGDQSAMANMRATVDQGFMVITRISNDGFFLTDFDGVHWDAASSDWTLEIGNMYFRSSYAYNFSTPRNLAEGDCLVQLDGTVQPYYGFTELSRPTWKKGDDAFCLGLVRAAGLQSCDPAETDTNKINDCRDKLDRLANTPFPLTTLIVDLPDGRKVSVWDSPSNSGGTSPESFPAAKRFESALVEVTDVDMFTDYQRCDRNGNGIVDFSITEEGNCSDNCGAAPGCVVAETYEKYHQWAVNFLDGQGQRRKVTIVSQGGIPKFDPLVSWESHKGGTPQHLARVVGTMRYLQFGRPRWTIEPRRPTDCPDCKN